jgi:hypothetical protein
MSISVSRAARAAAAAFAVAALSVGVPSSAQAARASAGDRAVSYTIVNDTELRMRLTDSDVTEGDWTSEPVSLIKPDQQAHFGSESVEDHGGTGGTVTYSTTDGDIVISWDNAYREDTKFRCEVPSSMTCDAEGDDPQDPRPDVTLTIS